MRHKIFTLCFLLFTISFAQNLNRQIIPLDGYWKFAIDSTDVGKKDNWRTTLPANLSKEVLGPSHLEY